MNTNFLKHAPNFFFTFSKSTPLILKIFAMHTSNYFFLSKQPLRLRRQPRHPPRLQERKSLSRVRCSGRRLTELPCLWHVRAPPNRLACGGQQCSGPHGSHRLRRRHEGRFLENIEERVPTGGGQLRTPGHHRPRSPVLEDGEGADSAHHRRHAHPPQRRLAHHQRRQEGVLRWWFAREPSLEQRRLRLCLLLPVLLAVRAW